MRILPLAFFILLLALWAISEAIPHGLILPIPRSPRQFVDSLRARSQLDQTIRITEICDSIPLVRTINQRFGRWPGNYQLARSPKDLNEIAVWNWIRIDEHNESLMMIIVIVQKAVVRVEVSIAIRRDNDLPDRGEQRMTALISEELARAICSGEPDALEFERNFIGTARGHGWKPHNNKPYFPKAALEFDFGEPGSLRKNRAN
jgi:hypothetical protein